jgi:hypothetical protein
MPLSSASEGASSVAKASALASASGIVADLRFARNVDGVSVPERVCTRARRVRVAVSVVVVVDGVTEGRAAALPPRRVRWRPSRRRETLITLHAQTAEVARARARSKSPCNPAAAA